MSRDIHTGLPGQVPDNTLRRVLSAGFGIAATLGGIIGLGILRTPGEIAGVVSDPWLFTGLWLAGGLFSLMSIAVAAEMAAMNPRSGGYTVWIRRAFGPFPGFLIGWVDWLSFCGTLALKAVVLVEYTVLLWPSLAGWKMPGALLLVTAFAALQARGVMLGGRIQKVAAAVMAVMMLGFSLALLAGDAAAVPATSDPRTGLKAWGLVVAAIVFTYDGWLAAAYFGGEISGGGRALARACVRGVALVVALYMLLMASLAFSVPLQAIAGAELALASAVELSLTATAASTVVVAAVLILLAHLNLNYMQASRVMHALAVDGVAVRRAARVSRRGNPLFAVLLTWACAVLLVLSGGFEFLLELCVFFFIILYVTLLAGLLRLRRREPGAERPWRAWGHPWATWVSLAGWTFIALFQAVAAAETVLYALAMVAVSWPVYHWLARRGLAREG